MECWRNGWIFGRGCNRHFIQNAFQRVCFICLLFFDSCCCVFVVCEDTCLMLIFPGKLLSSGQSQTRSAKTPVSHLSGAQISCSVSSDRLPPELSQRVLLTLQSLGGSSPSSCLSPGDVLLCGSETPLCRPVCSTQVWTQVSRPCFTLHLSSEEGLGRGDGLSYTLCCLLFCPTFACWGDADLDCVNVDMTFTVTMLLV